MYFLNFNFFQPLGLVPFHPARLVPVFWCTYKKENMTGDAHEFCPPALFSTTTQDTVIWGWKLRRSETFSVELKNERVLRFFSLDRSLFLSFFLSIINFVCSRRLVVTISSYSWKAWCVFKKHWAEVMDKVREELYFLQCVAVLVQIPKGIRGFKQLLRCFLPTRIEDVSSYCFQGLFKNLLIPFQNTIRCTQHTLVLFRTIKTSLSFWIKGLRLVLKEFQ